MTLRIPNATQTAWYTLGTSALLTTNQRTMIPLADTHCHLLAGLDDGPGTLDEAVQMCRMAYQEGTRVIAATAHICEQWPEVTAERIRGTNGFAVLEGLSFRAPKPEPPKKGWFSRSP